MTVEITRSAEEFLARVADESRVVARSLALLMLDLDADPRPANSHVLPSPPEYEARVWDLEGWQISYCIRSESIEIGVIDRKGPSS